MINDSSYASFLNLVTDRYSCRKFSPKPVTRETVLAILEAARLAPSACNRQPWEFIVADTPELCSTITECCNPDRVRNVQTFIIACGLHDEAWHRADDKKDHTDIDVAIAVEHICLAATSLGVGSCWICSFNHKRIAETFRLPERVEPIAIIPLGYPEPGTTVPEKVRKPLETIVKWGKF